MEPQETNATEIQESEYIEETVIFNSKNIHDNEAEFMMQNGYPKAGFIFDLESYDGEFFLPTSPYGVNIHPNQDFMDYAYIGVILNVRKGTSAQGPVYVVIYETIDGAQNAFVCDEFTKVYYK